MKGKTFVAVLAALLMGCNACSQVWNAKRIKESKNYVTKEIKVDNFHELNVVGSPSVHFTQKAGKPSVKIHTSDNIAEALNIYEKNGTLYVGFKKDYNVSYSKLDIEITAADLNSISLSGSGDIYLDNGLNTDKLTVSLAGSGDIAGKNIRCTQLTASLGGSGDVNLTDVECSTATANLRGSGDLALQGLLTSTVTASIAGSGDLTVAGKAEKASYKVTGSGDLHATGMKANYVNARVSGSGDITCHATDYLKAYTTGSGSIGYKGNPQLDIAKKGIHKL